MGDMHSVTLSGRELQALRVVEWYNEQTHEISETASVAKMKVLLRISGGGATFAFKHQEPGTSFPPLGV